MSFAVSSVYVGYGGIFRLFPNKVHKMLGSGIQQGRICHSQFLQSTVIVKDNSYIGLFNSDNKSKLLILAINPDS